MWLCYMMVQTPQTLNCPAIYESSRKHEGQPELPSNADATRITRKLEEYVMIGPVLRSLRGYQEIAEMLEID